MKKILFLDFDGVLFDTVNEAYNICINIKQFENIILSQDSFEKFKLYRPFVGPAWNYYYVMKNIISNNNNFDFIESKETKKFENDFFIIRQSMKNKNYKKWLSLNNVYPFLKKLETLISKNLEVYIITTKDEETVLNLLEYKKISWIKKENIFGKRSYNKFTSKKNILLYILKNTPLYKAIYIDDLYLHLQKCENIKNLQCIQADWGYINEKSKYICSCQEALEKVERLGEIHE